MISKAILRERLSKAIGQEIDETKFAWFFHRFCDVYNLPKEIIWAKNMDDETVKAFCEYAGYDLRSDNTFPLTAKL